MEKTLNTVSIKDDTQSDEVGQILIDEKKLTRKVDYRVLSIMFITYSLQFMDKLALSAGSVFGIKKDLGLKRQDYSWSSSVFYFGYLLGNFIVTRLLQVLPIGKFVSVSVCLWAICLAVSASCFNYSSLIAARFFLGLLESSISPAFVLLTSMWWKQSQQPARSGVWFAGNDFGGIVSSFVAFGLGHINGKIASWRYIFIVYGCATFLWSFVMFAFLPDSPQTARFLTSEEKQYYAEHLPQSKVESKWDWEQAKSCVFDINLLLLLMCTVLCILPNSGVISYGFIIVDNFGFTPIQTTLLQLPGSVISWMAITSTGLLGTRFKNARCILIAAVCVVSIVGGCLIYRGSSRGVKLLGYYFVSVQPAVFPIVLSMVASNFRGSTRRSIVSNAIFIVYCACNIGGPQLFRYQDAPEYSPAFESWIICYCLNIAIVVVIALKYRWDNKKQESKDQETLPTTLDAPEYTDPKFRYMY
ncbi:LAMI_0B05930g1_1 [Lachancea mirantina]|uniref:LAMI_0B05930g1_1 n=1 Tax=Lachancea mirantina TaxID=1230905 RepID=A0A1G4IWG3_9SACH|nr:LAMI_0B05930g1_1 [Lachancea mirantina]